jgi:uncharacterized protein YbjT (DUF2867 family)
VVADLATGTGLGPAVKGVDTVLHLASASRGDAWTVDVAGTRALAVAAREAGVEHLVYVSIPGVDRVPYPFYRVKFAAEQVVRAAAVPWTVLRATQFHQLAATMLRRARRGPLLPVGIGWRFEPVDTGDVAAHLVDLVAAGPAGEVLEFGGPEVLDAVDVARSWLAAQGSGGRVVPFPIPGKFSAAVRAGGLLASPGAPRGTVTWGEWLARTGGPDVYPPD